MTFNLRAIIDDADLPPFRFEGLDGAIHELPHMQALTPRQALAAMGGDFEAVLKDIAPDVADLLLDIPAHATNALIEEWMRHSGVDPTGREGKSPAPSPSSTSTATRSKRTSRSTASRSRR